MPPVQRGNGLSLGSEMTRQTCSTGPVRVGRRDAGGGAVPPPDTARERGLWAGGTVERWQGDPKETERALIYRARYPVTGPTVGEGTHTYFSLMCTLLAFL